MLVVVRCVDRAMLPSRDDGGTGCGNGELNFETDVGRTVRERERGGGGGFGFDGDCRVCIWWLWTVMLMRMDSLRRGFLLDDADGLICASRGFLFSLLFYLACFHGLSIVKDWT